jgi:hypothetical protein
VVVTATNWRASLRDRGYAHFPRAVPSALLDAARAAIAEDLRLRYDAAREREYGSRTYCPQITASGPIMDLYERPPVRDILDEAIGFDALGHSDGQIAIRWAHNVDREYPPEWHIDGISSPDNGVPPGALDTLTAVVGVFLSTQPRAFAGNLTVWPGSHRILARHFRVSGPQSLYDPLPQLDLGAPEQLVCEAGDVVLMHYQLAHTAAVNTSAVDRIAVYFRTLLRDVDEGRWDRWECLADPWRGWRINDA